MLLTVLFGFLLLGLTRHRAFSVVTNPLFAVRDATLSNAICDGWRGLERWRLRRYCLTRQPAAATLSNAICDGWRGLERWRLRRYFVPSNSTKTTVFFVQPAEP